MSVLDEYLEDLTKQNISHETALSYRRDVEHYKQYLGRRWERAMMKASSASLLEYLEDLRVDGKSDATIHRNLVSLRSLYRYFVKEGRLTNDPTEHLMLPREEKKLPVVLTVGEVELLLDQPKSNSLKGCRDKAMLEVLYATGIRVSELVGLNMEDVHLPSGSITCHNGDKSRFIPMGKAASKAVADYIRMARPMMSAETEEALFVNLSGKRITRQGFWKIVKEYQEAAGITTPITPHTLRHSFATHLLQNGADIAIVQEMLGNSDAAYTRIYMEVKESKIAEAYRKAHPRA